MAISDTQQQLVDSLVADGIVDKDALMRVTQEAKQTGQNIEQLLVAEKLVNEEQLITQKGKVLNIPAQDLRATEIDQKVLEIIPLEVAENYKMIAFKLDAKVLHVGLVQPQNFKAIEALDFLAKKSGYTVKYYVISASSFSKAIKQYEEFQEEVEEALENAEDVFLSKDGAGTADEMEQVIKSAPVSKIVLVIFRHATDGRASDIHIEPSTQNTKVRYRIDGQLKTSLVLPKYIHSAIVARIKVLAGLRLDETRLPQDGRIRFTMDGRDIDLRVSTLPLFEGEKVVLRILDSSAEIPTFEQLGFSQWHIDQIKEGMKKPHGIFLLTGPTGSGKTTTLYTALHKLNQEGLNIVTLEDPIEYYMTGVNQSQVNPEVGYTFASGLRAILRQDPNLIMLGEIRDEETTQLVVHASLTGHMVLTTLHTNDAIGALPRMADLGAEPFLLSSVINVIIAQRLARKICPDCKVKDEIPEHLLKSAKKQIDMIPKEYLGGINVENLEFWKGKGCASCGESGYKGRLAVAEVITVTPELRALINRSADIAEYYEELKNQNFITLVQDCIIKSLHGNTTMEEVIRVSQL